MRKVLPNVLVVREDQDHGLHVFGHIVEGTNILATRRVQSQGSAVLSHGCDIARETSLCLSKLVAHAEGFRRVDGMRVVFSKVG